MVSSLSFNLQALKVKLELLILIIVMYMKKIYDCASFQRNKDDNLKTETMVQLA